MTLLTDKVRTCFVCKLTKPVADFYANGRNLCRRCNRARVILWAKQNPARAKQNGLNYRNSDQGSARRTKYRREWRKHNTAGDKERFARYVARCADGYIRQLLRQMGNLQPTGAEIEKHRQRVQFMRARRTLTVMAYGARI